MSRGNQREKDREAQQKKLQAAGVSFHSAPLFLGILTSITEGQSRRK
jgi:hypothetical protein